MNQPLDLNSLLPDVLDQWRAKSRQSLYRTDFEAWQWDVLGHRTYKKMRDIINTTLFGPKRRTAIKSANGCAKSFSIAEIVFWWCTVFPPNEVLAILSAPTISQIEKVLIAYLKVNFGDAKANGYQPVGRINESMEWIYDGAQGKEFLAFGKRPTDRDIVSSFQGTRKMRTLVALDEAGGVPQELFTAAEAVTTGSESLTVAISNPDRVGTEMWSIFNNDKYEPDWNRFTLSAFDLPTFTGERVYEDSEKEEKLLKGLTSVEWVEHKRRAWGENSARWAAKVMGEFPSSDDNSFFSQQAIDKAFDTDLEPSDYDPLILGVDVALGGQDETVAYLNHGGHVRYIKAWEKMNAVDGAESVHNLACELGVNELRIDASGEAGGVAQNLQFLEQYASKPYILTLVKGAWSSPDETRWNRLKSWSYDNFLEQINYGKIDLDIGDKELREELISQTYAANNRGALQITPKREMRKLGLKSPDHLDAAIYSSMDLSWMDEPSGGETTFFDPEDVNEMYGGLVEVDSFPW